MNKLLKIFFILILVVASGIYWLWSIDERGFVHYITQWFTENELATTSFDCSMNSDHGRSRAGKCEFLWPSEKLSLLESALQLISVPVENFFEGCSTDVRFSIRNISVVQYSTKEPPGPIFKGNTSTSFLRMYFNKTSGVGCIDLHYPYG